MGAFLFGNHRSSRSPFDVGSPPSVLIRFQRYWGWFWSRKPSLISGILRGRCFILWNWFVESNIVGQRSRVESWHSGLLLSEVDVRVSLYSGRGVVCTRVDKRYSLVRIPPFSYSCVCCVSDVSCASTLSYL